jgi:hypothetical protein
MRRDIYISAVLEKCELLQQLRLWAAEPQVSPAAWMENFTSELDRVLAASLLDQLIYFSDQAVDQLLSSALNRFEDALLRRNGGSQILSDLVITPIEDENPNRSDSGNVFCRKARLSAGISEEKIVDPAEALTHAKAGRPVLFLDDFIGTGEQLLGTWERDYHARTPTSFAEVYARSPFPAFAVTLVVTAQATKRLRDELPSVELFSTHELGTGHSCHSLVAPPTDPLIENYQNELRDFLARHSASLALKDHMRSYDHALYGFHGNGYMVGFEHSIPDSTLPILWATGPAPWARLLKPR